MKRRDLPSTVLRASPLGTERLCRRCDRWLLWTIDHFYRSRRNHSGMTTRCRTCVKEANALHKKVRRGRLGHTPYCAHADDASYWARYRAKNQRTTRKGAKP